MLKFNPWKPVYRLITLSLIVGWFSQEAAFKPYPSPFELPAGFIASPIHDGPEKIGVGVFLFPIQTLSTFMDESGETYLLGSDYLTRFDSFLAPVKHSVTGPFKKPGSRTCRNHCHQSGPGR